MNLATLVLFLAMLLTSFIPPQADKAEIQWFETAYLKTVDDGNVQGQLDLVSRDPGVFSIVEGEAWVGWSAVKAQAEMYVPVSRLFRTVVDSQQAFPLGPDVVLVVLQIHAEKRDAAMKSLPDGMKGTLTHVLKRGPKGWLVFHEHVSNQFTYDYLKWRLTILEAQRKAADSTPGNPPK